MKKILYLGLALCTLAACKKKKDDVITPTPVVQVLKIKTLTIGGDAVNYTYDAQGRILTRVNPTSNWRYEFVYNGNTVTENYFIGTTLSTTKVYELNANGLVIKEGYSFPAGSIPYKSIYTYNANNQVASIVRSNTINSNGNTETYFYTGTMLDSSRTTFSTNSDLHRFWYSYFTDKTNTIAYKNQGYLFFADEGTMPIKKITSIFKTGNFFNTQVDDYTYLFDAENRITKRTITTAGGGGSSVNDVTYY